MNKHLSTIIHDASKFNPFCAQCQLEKLDKEMLLRLKREMVEYTYYAYQAQKEEASDSHRQSIKKEGR